MTQYPGPYGRPGTPSNGRLGALKPRLRSIQLTIDDTAGTTWTVSRALVTDPKPRSTGAKVAGWVVALLMAAGGFLLTAWFLTWTISVIHEWWAFVPEMPYSIALKLGGISLLALVIGRFGAEFVKYALGTKRVPDTSDDDDSAATASSRIG
jgi:hypothetical protein